MENLIPDNYQTSLVLFWQIIWETFSRQLSDVPCTPGPGEMIRNVLSSATFGWSIATRWLRYSPVFEKLKIEDEN